MDDGLAPGLFIGAILGAFLVLILVLIDRNPMGSTDQQFAAICAYEGGEVQGDVCIKDDSVITFDIPGGE